VTAALGAVRTTLASVSDEPVWSMDGSQTTEAIRETDAAIAQLVQQRSRLLRQAEALDLPGDIGARTLAAWDARTNRVARREAHRRAFLAKALGTHPATDRLLAAGGLQVEQAEAVLRGVTELPADLDPDLSHKAEGHLLGLTAVHDAKALKNLARHLLEVVAPEAAEQQIAHQLEREERDAEAANSLTVWQDAAGRGHGKFTLDPFSFACFKKAMLAAAAPRHRASKGPLGERLPRAEELGRAFADYVRRYPTSKLPTAGGMNATVVVLLPFESLMGGLKAAKLDTGEEVSASMARRIASEAGIIPAVLGGRSEVLDLGRKKRFHSQAQRIVATIEQGGCIAEGHDCEPAFTQMHHPIPWAKGGETNRDGWMLCPPAHRLVHDPRYTHEQLPNGKIRFHRRT
jgi:hypothetical protein